MMPWLGLAFLVAGRLVEINEFSYNNHWTLCMQFSVFQLYLVNSGYPVA